MTTDLDGFRSDLQSREQGLRRLPLNLLRRETTAKGGIAAKRKQAGWNNEYLLKILSN